MNKYTNVSNYKVLDGQLIFSRGEKLREKLLIYNQNIICVGVANYEILENKIIYNLWSDKNHSFIYYIDSAENHKITNKRFIEKINNCLIFKSEKTYYYLDFNLMEMFSSKFYISQIDNNFGFSTDGMNIVKSDFSDKIIWSYSFIEKETELNKDDPDEIEKIVGRNNNLIWFITKKERLIALNIVTGVPVKKYSHIPNDKSLGFTMVKGIGDIFFSEVDGHLHSLSASYYTKINAITLEIDEEINLKNKIDGFNNYEFIFSPLLQGKYFTFLTQAQDKPGGIRFVAIFNYLTKKISCDIEVISEDEKKNGNSLVRPQPLLISGDSFYIKDLQNNHNRRGVKTLPKLLFNLI